MKTRARGGKINDGRAGPICKLHAHGHTQTHTHTHTHTHTEHRHGAHKKTTVLAKLVNHINIKVEIHFKQTNIDSI